MQIGEAVERFYGPPMGRMHDIFRYIGPLVVAGLKNRATDHLMVNVVDVKRLACWYAHLSGRSGGDSRRIVKLPYQSRLDRLLDESGLKCRQRHRVDFIVRESHRSLKRFRTPLLETFRNTEDHRS